MSTSPASHEGWLPPLRTACLVLAPGLVIEGIGCGATGEAIGEVCFNTAITGHEEILSDPSYAGQIVTFTFPHVGNVGANKEDVETVSSSAQHAVRGVVLQSPITPPSSWRAHWHFDEWLKARGIIGIYGIDTRALTTYIREHGMPNAVIAHHPDGKFDIPALMAQAKAWPGIDGMDLVPGVTTPTAYNWTGERPEWVRKDVQSPKFHVVAIDYGVKQNILNLLCEAGCHVTIVPATTPYEDIIALKPDGVFLSNGPGDPAETGKYAVPLIQKVLEAKIPTFGICLGHQLMGLALGGRTIKMHQGHHGANHPVQDLRNKKVEITSMNHGFAVDSKSLPKHVEQTHVSLFDGTNCGLALTDRPAFSVQHHPEASPGPQDSHYFFRQFVEMMAASQKPHHDNAA